VVKDQLLVARNLATVPEAAKATTLKEAVKIIKRSEDKARYAAKGAEVSQMEAESRHTLIHGDAFDVMSDPIHHGKYRVILSDPPYGMGADTFGDSGNADRTQGGHSYDDSYEGWLVLMGELLPLTWQVAAPQAHLYLFCDFDRFHELRSALQAIGWKVFRTPLVMHKTGNSGRVPWPKNGPRRQYELVLFAVKGDMLVNNIMHDVFEGPLISERMGHPAEKPVAALKNLLSRSANAGDHVLDMCCGCGPIFEAGHELGLMVTGVEKDAAYYGMAKVRKEGLK
jgi:DNA modification methylase